MTRLRSHVGILFIIHIPLDVDTRTRCTRLKLLQHKDESREVELSDSIRSITIALRLPVFSFSEVGFTGTVSDQ